MKAFNKTLAAMTAIPIAGFIALGGASVATATTVADLCPGAEICVAPDYGIVEEGNSGSIPDVPPLTDEGSAEVPFIAPDPLTSDQEKLTPPYIDPETGGTVSPQSDGNYVDSVTGLVVSPEVAAKASADLRAAQAQAQADAAKDAAAASDQASSSETFPIELLVLIGAGVILGIAGVVLYLNRSSLAGLNIIRGRFGRSKKS